eukprot:Gb_29100 [translate_table: standard]
MLLSVAERTLNPFRSAIPFGMGAIVLCNEMFVYALVENSASVVCPRFSVAWEGKLVKTHITDTQTKPMVINAKCGYLDDSRRVFDEMPKRNVLPLQLMSAMAAMTRLGCSFPSVPAKEVREDIIGNWLVFDDYAVCLCRRERSFIFSNKSNLKPNNVVFADTVFLNRDLFFMTTVRSWPWHSDLINSSAGMSFPIVNNLEEVYGG